VPGFRFLAPGFRFLVADFHFLAPDFDFLVPALDAWTSRGLKARPSCAEAKKVQFLVPNPLKTLPRLQKWAILYFA
jgi:hypothetical protein